MTNKKTLAGLFTLVLSLGFLSLAQDARVASAGNDEDESVPCCELHSSANGALTLHQEKLR